MFRALSQAQRIERSAVVARTRYRAPGRVNLIGEHTDYSGGLVLPAAIDLAVTLDVEEIGGDRIVVTSEQAQGEVDVAADGSAPPARGWGRYVSAMAGELAALGRRSVGLRGTLRSTLPQGAGLSSSAALEVVLGLALLEVAGLALEPLELAGAAQRAERRAVGVPCGIMDQAACLLGAEGAAVLLHCGTLAHRHVRLPDDLALLVIDSGVSRTLEGSGYAARREELEGALVVLDGRAPADVAVDELPALAPSLDAVAVQRLRHVVTENARVHEAVAALDAGDVGALGDLFAASHASLRDDYEVSTPELDLLVELAVDEGAVGARLTGGGFGGAIVALADAAAAEAVGTRVRDRYRARGGREATTVVCRAGPGAARVPQPDHG